jgi:hypothetical protein
MNKVLGQGVADLLSAAVGLLSELTSGGPVGLLLTAVEDLFMVAEWLARPGASKGQGLSIDASLN